MNTENAQIYIAHYANYDAANRALDNFSRESSSTALHNGETVLIQKNERGETTINERSDFSSGDGAGLGAMFGGLIGLFGGPAGFAWGLAIGAGAGAVVASKDKGFDNERLAEFGQCLNENESALIVTADIKLIHELANSLDENTVNETLTSIRTSARQSLDKNQNGLMTVTLSEGKLTLKNNTKYPGDMALFGIDNNGYGPKIV